MMNTNFKLYSTTGSFSMLLQIWSQCYLLKWNCSLCFSFFVFVWVFVDVFTVYDFLYFIFQQIYCLNILRMPFKIKRKKVKCLINARQCSAFYILLYNHLYTFTNFCDTFSNYIQFYVMIFYTYTYVYIHSISTLYWNLWSGLFLGIAKCDHL